MPLKKIPGLFQKLLKPKEEAADFLKINLAKLFASGYRGIILDLDNTILLRREKELNQNFLNWISQAEHLGFKVAIVSNNFKHTRLKKIYQQIGLPTFNPAFKPLPFIFKLAFRKIQVRAKKIVIIGDQILTDILGGNLLGCYTILVEPLYLETNPFRKLVQQLDAVFVRLIRKI